MNNKFNVKLSWSFYDWANSAWSAIIITFIFSRYFVDVLAPDKDLGTLYWTWTIGISSLVAALLSPILGSISDQALDSLGFIPLPTSISSLDQRKNLDLVLTGMKGEMAAHIKFNAGYFQTIGSWRNLTIFT